MAVTPHTNLFLLRCPLGINNKNQLTFNNPTDQYNYFQSLTKLEVDNISYQRHNNIIRYSGHIDSLLYYNYVIYQNENYSNKWFYAFITNMTYVNDNRTDITIATDVWQTWQFNLNFKESFVEREMINVVDDIPGINLVPEGLETGESKIAGQNACPELAPLAIIAYSRNPNTDGLTEQFVPAQGIIANGIPNRYVFLGL